MEGIAVLTCDCCNRVILEDAVRMRESRDDVGPDVYIVVLNVHERHWLTATKEELRRGESVVFARRA